MSCLQLSHSALLASWLQPETWSATNGVLATTHSQVRSKQGLVLGLYLCGSHSDLASTSVLHCRHKWWHSIHARTDLSASPAWTCFQENPRSGPIIVISVNIAAAAAAALLLCCCAAATTTTATSSTTTTTTPMTAMISLFPEVCACKMHFSSIKAKRCARNLSACNVVLSQTAPLTPRKGLYRVMRG